MKPTKDEEAILRSLLYQRGRSLLLKKCKEDVDEALSRSVALEDLRALFAKMGLREHDLGRQGIMYEYTELEEKVWSKLTGTTPELYGREHTLVCNHEPSIMYGGVCGCEYYGAGGSGPSPGSSMSLEDQRRATGIAREEPEHFVGSKDDLPRGL